MNYFLPLAKNYNIIIFRDTNSKVWFHSELMTPKSIFFSDHNGRRTNWGHSWDKHGTNGCYVSSKYSKNFSNTYVMFTDPSLQFEFLVSNLSRTFIWNKFVFMFIWNDRNSLKWCTQNNIDCCFERIENWFCLKHNFFLVSNFIWHCFYVFWRPSQSTAAVWTDV